jgi:hypothetical protein
LKTFVASSPVVNVPSTTDEFPGLSRQLRIALENCGPRQAARLKRLLRTFREHMLKLDDRAVFDVHRDEGKVRSVQFLDLTYELEPNGRSVVLRKSSDRCGFSEATPLWGLSKHFADWLWSEAVARAEKAYAATTTDAEWNAVAGRFLQMGDIRGALDNWAARQCAFGRPIWQISRVASACVKHLVRRSSVWAAACACEPRWSRGVSIWGVNRIAAKHRAYTAAFRDSKRLMKLLSATVVYRPAKRILSGPQGGVIARLKSYWRGMGLTEQGWKYLHRLDAASMNALLHPIRHGELSPEGNRRWAFVTSVLAQQTSRGVRRLLPTIRGLVCDWFGRGGGWKDWDHPLDRRFAQVAVQKALAVCRSTPTSARAAKCAALAAEIRDVRDWLHHGAADERALVDQQGKPPQFGWHWFKDREHRWATTVRGRGGGAIWSVPFEKMDVGGFMFQCLASQREMNEEGHAMHHCVASYGDLCENGEAVILSAWQNGARQATVELSPSRQRWYIRQLRGPCNALVEDSSLLAAALEVAARIGTWAPGTPQIDVCLAAAPPQISSGAPLRTPPDPAAPSEIAA